MLTLEAVTPKSMDRESVVEKLIESGLWVNFIRKDHLVLCLIKVRNPTRLHFNLDTILAPDYNQTSCVARKEGRAHFQKV